MEKTFYQLILASQSPRRKELVSYLNIPFSIKVSHIEEGSDCKDPRDFVLDIAQKKAQFIVQKMRLENQVILSSDTIVVLDKKIMGKPKDKKDADEILNTLSGKTHQVYTAIYLHHKDFQDKQVIKSDVTFYSIDSKVMELYFMHNEFIDKAGAYGVQGAAQLFIKEIQGSYSNIVGLPLAELVELFKCRFGENWRDVFV